MAELKPRLRAGVHISRQVFRARLWYVVQDQANNCFFRINTAGYGFIGMLDGSRSVRQAWASCNARLGDEAPTQGEVIALLGQLSSHNLLEADVAPDAAAMFDRFKRRRSREMQGRLMNLLFPRIELFDPDAILDHGVFLVGWIFDWAGLLVWLLIIGAAAYVMLSGGPVIGTLITDSTNILRPDNWLLLLLAFIVDKTVHECGHAIACKKFGKRYGTGGEVHVIGIMLLIFTPVPYVDATSAWLLPDKWRRAIVGAAGMWVEFALAAIAAIVWRWSDPGSALHAFSYNLMFIASVATVFFNANPFLRYDGYYILADLLEIPNLFGRAVQFATYLLRRYVFGLKQAVDPTETPGQRCWLLIYLILSGVVRVLVCSGIILLLVANLRRYPELTLLLLIMAIIASATWVLVPVARGAWYPVSSPELLHHRARAVGISAAAVLALATGIGMVPMAHHSRVLGIVRTAHQRGVYARSGGFLKSATPSGTLREPVMAGAVLARLSNPVLQTRLAAARCKLDAVGVKYRKAAIANPVLAQILLRRMAALRTQVRRLSSQLNQLVIRAPVGGVWVNRYGRLHLGAYVRRGDRIGTVVNLSSPLIYAPAGQSHAAQIIRRGAADIELRLPGRPSDHMAAQVVRVYPGSASNLPSAALSYLAGGPFAPRAQSRSPTQSSARFFILVLRPVGHIRLLPGETVVARVRLADQPLGEDFLDTLRRILQSGTGL